MKKFMKTPQASATKTAQIDVAMDSSSVAGIAAREA